MKDEDVDRLIDQYREKFGQDPPYNMDPPDEWVERVKKAVESGEAMPVPDYEDDGRILH